MPRMTLFFQLAFQVRDDRMQVLHFRVRCLSSMPLFLELQEGG
jgi:hypothetical protein